MSAAASGVSATSSNPPIVLSRSRYARSESQRSLGNSRLTQRESRPGSRAIGKLAARTSPTTSRPSRSSRSARASAAAVPTQ